MEEKEPAKAVGESLICVWTQIPETKGWSAMPVLHFQLSHTQPCPSLLLTVETASLPGELSSISIGTTHGWLYKANQTIMLMFLIG